MTFLNWNVFDSILTSIPSSSTPDSQEKGAWSQLLDSVTSGLNLTLNLTSEDTYNFFVSRPIDLALNLTFTVTSYLHVFCSHSNELITNVSQEIFNGNLTLACDLLRTETLTLVEWLDLTDFQWKLIREFSYIIAGNVILVFFAWRVYGPRITAKFFTDSGQTELSDFKTGVGQLKLPKEHDFKYK